MGLSSYFTIKLAVLGACLFLFGLIETANSSRSAWPKVYTVAQITAANPTEGVYTIRGGVLDLSDCLKRTSGNNQEYYVALTAPIDAALIPRPTIIVRLNDPKLKSIVEDDTNLPDDPTPAQIAAFKSQHPQMLVPVEVTGQISGAIDLNQRLADAMRTYPIVLDQGAGPSFGIGISCLVLGAILCAIFYSTVRTSAPQKVETVYFQARPGWVNEPQGTSQTNRPEPCVGFVVLVFF